MRINKKDEIINLIGALLLFIIIALFIYFRNHSSLGEIKENHVYTVGTVRDYSPSRTGRVLKYTFSYKNEVYVGGYTFYGNDDRFAIGKKFLVIFNPKDPETKFFIPYSLPDSTYAPIEGWKSPPLSITEEDIMRYLDEKY